MTQEARPRFRLSAWPLIYAAVGMALVLLASYLAERANLRQSLPLDLRGQTASGTAERKADGAYRISYKHPDGSIQAREARWLGFQRIDGDEGSIDIRFSLDGPGRFQPMGISILPTAAAGIVFITGMLLVFRGRHVALQEQRAVRRRGKEAGAHEGRSGIGDQDPQ